MEGWMAEKLVYEWLHLQQSLLTVLISWKQTYRLTNLWYRGVY